MSAVRSSRLIECPKCQHKFRRVRHGTVSAFTRGCRCVDCRSAMAAYSVKYYKKNKAKLKQRYLEKTGAA